MALCSGSNISTQWLSVAIGSGSNGDLRMKVMSATLENYCAFKEAKLDTNELTVIVGKNGTGKSSVMEGLSRLFAEFNAVGGGVSPGLQEYYWHKRDLSQPIRFTVKIELNDEEYE